MVEWGETVTLRRDVGGRRRSVVEIGSSNVHVHDFFFELINTWGDKSRFSNTRWKQW